MEWKSILCAYSGDAARGSGLRHAVRVAKHHGAHLTGVLRYGTPEYRQLIKPHLPQALIDQLQSADQSMTETIKARFFEMAETGGLGGQADFFEITPARDGSLAEFSHAYDLIVMGTHSEDSSEAHLSPHPDLVALRSGRPVMVVPNGYDGEGLAERVLVAWDGARAATRALMDVMHILAEKSGVKLVSVGAAPRGTDRMLTNLTRHGIDASHSVVTRKGSIADTLLAEADAFDAKLLVLGAFEHSKFAHDLFGGVTTDVIAKTKIPVIMAH